jgi:uncharacterized membrane protein HdeD (DUF308 family)
MEEKEILFYAGIVMIVSGLISMVRSFNLDDLSFIIAPLLLIIAGVIFFQISRKKMK